MPELKITQQNLSSGLLFLYDVQYFNCASTVCRPIATASFFSHYAEIGVSLRLGTRARTSGPAGSEQTCQGTAVGSALLSGSGGEESGVGERAKLPSTARDAEGETFPRPNTLLE